MQAKLVQITRARFRNKGNEYSFSLLTRVTSTHLAMLIGSPVHLWLWPKGQLRVTQYILNFRLKVPKKPLELEYWKRAVDPLIS